MSKLAELLSQISSAFDWFIAFRNPWDIVTNHWSYLACEILVCLCGLLTLIHAARLGGRYFFLWLAILFHGITVELVSYSVPDIDIFWHAQSTTMLLGKRLPLHIILLYPVLMYTANVAVYRLRLPAWSEPFAVGLATVLIDVPFEIIGVKSLWWTWHDTDPNVTDRSFYVPWVSYIIQANFSAVLSILIKLLRKGITGTTTVEAYRETDRWKETTCSILTGLLGMPFGVLFLIPEYYTLHDVLLIHTENCAVIYLFLLVFMIWAADRNPSIGARTGKFVFDEIVIIIVTFYVTLFGIAYLSKPEDIVAEGLHEKVGPCDKIKDVMTPIGMVLKKRQFLCLNDYHEPYYDFHCIGSTDLPDDGASWYTICGTPHFKLAEYLLVVGSACVFGLGFFYNLLVKSGTDLVQSPFKIKRF